MNPTNHQHDEVLEKILDTITPSISGEVPPENYDKALIALHSYIEKEKREAYQRGYNSGYVGAKTGRSKKRGEAFESYIIKLIDKRLSALRASHDGKEG